MLMKLTSSLFGLKCHMLQLNLEIDFEFLTLNQSFVILFMQVFLVKNLPCLSIVCSKQGEFFVSCVQIQA